MNLNQLHIDLAYDEPVCGVFRFVLDAGGKQEDTTHQKQQA